MLAAENILWQVKQKIILDIPAFAVRPGETVAVIGPNGSGKSSLLKILAGLQRPSAGQVSLAGENVYAAVDSVRLRRRTATVFQEAVLLDGTVEYNAALGLRLRRLPERVVAARTKAWLGEFAVAHLANRHVRHLSGGEAQRVCLARAFAVEPDVLFLDEPFAFLDAPTRSGLLGSLGRILRETRQTAVFVSHDYTEVSILADRVAALLDGRIVQTDTPAELFAAPRTVELAGLLGFENIIPARCVAPAKCIASRSGLSFITREPGGSGEGWIAFRGEDGRVTPATAVLSEEDVNCYAGTVREVLPRGNKYAVAVDCGEPLKTVVGQSEYWRYRLEPGQPINLTVRPEFVHFIRK
ncbi:MAG: ABC transporter ATP-binding protein [bacterium]|jgi:tungstate transport system ATP-binding protein